MSSMTSGVKSTAATAAATSESVAKTVAEPAKFARSLALDIDYILYCRGFKFNPRLLVVIPDVLFTICRVRI